MRTENLTPSGGVFQHNDVDAFRHAYVSGVFTQEYGENAAEVFGRLNEFLGPGVYSNSKNPHSLNNCFTLIACFYDLTKLTSSL